MPVMTRLINHAMNSDDDVSVCRQRLTDSPSGCNNNYNDSNTCAGCEVCCAHTSHDSFENVELIDLAYNIICSAVKEVRSITYIGLKNQQHFFVERNE